MKAIRDDRALLDKLLHDMESASELWRPTNYWEVEKKVLMPTIRQEGISHFRASSNSTYISFGVTSIPNILTNDFIPLTLYGKMFYNILQMFGVFNGHIGEHRRTFSAFQNTCFQMVLHCDSDKEILTITDSGLANPKDLFSPKGYEDLQYTIAFLRYFWQYLWLKKFVNFKQLNTIMELGSGYGGQAEVLCKLHPHLKYIICDIPPQVYVAEQYLKSCFPEQVMSYSETSGRNSIDLTEIGSKRIMVITPWQLERFTGKVSLFWNSASFQEMEPNIVENYIKVLQPLIDIYVYLLQLPAGQSMASKKGERYGVLVQTTLKHYLEFFHEFKLIEQNDAFVFTGARDLFCSGYSHMLFQRLTN